MPWPYSQRRSALISEKKVLVWWRPREGHGRRDGKGAGAAASEGPARRLQPRQPRPPPPPAPAAPSAPGLRDGSAAPRPLRPPDSEETRDGGRKDSRDPHDTVGRARSSARARQLPPDGLRLWPPPPPPPRPPPGPGETRAPLRGRSCPGEALPARVGPRRPPSRRHLQRGPVGCQGSAAGSAARRTRCRLDFGPSPAAGVARAEDSGRAVGPGRGGTSLAEALRPRDAGGYWGPTPRCAARQEGANAPEGSFLARDSSDDRYLLGSSFRSHGRTLRTRTGPSHGRFSLYEPPDGEGHTSAVALTGHSIPDSENGAFGHPGSRVPGSAPSPVRPARRVPR
uniref:Uncharacterized protein n=1 Tax=Canis lupus familiaris TaxID=9615 RepID=A0A8C0PNM5_CANLF